MSEWEDGLKRLMRSTPSEEIEQSVVNIMQGNADDRSAALTAATFADTALGLGILVLQPIDPTPDVNALFWNYDAMYGTFYKRISEASARGIIGPKTKENMRIVRLVRNVFAHAMANLTFDTPEISEACRILELEGYALHFSTGEREMRYRYCYACDVVFRKLLNWSAMPFALGFGTRQVKPTQPVLP